MFTGLIERVGEVRRVSSRASGAEVEISPGGPYEVALGDSVSVEGVCLTVTRVLADGFTVDVSRESLERSTLTKASAGTRVNLERALKLGDRLGGHLVTGHVDAVGKVAELRPEAGFMRMVIAAPAEVSELVVEKGSVAVAGVSLTVNGVSGDRFWMMLIPETIARTTLSGRRPGDEVNLESDLIGKYVAHVLGRGGNRSSDAALLAKLREEGFI